MLVARKRGAELLLQLAAHLRERGHQVLVDKATANLLGKAALNRVQLEVFAASGPRPQLAIALGGDGSFIHTSSMMVKHNVPVAGINLGTVGFLTDIPAESMIDDVDAILAGSYSDEKRIILRIKRKSPGKAMVQHIAINDLVVCHNEFNTLISLNVRINGRFGFNIRADGLVITTPTGSTAYGMAGGGPIIAPGSQSIGLVPLNPHSLTQRPLVIPADTSLTIVPANDARLQVDGRLLDLAPAGHKIEVSQNQRKLTIRHPESYDYYANLQAKLFWSK